MEQPTTIDLTQVSDPIEVTNVKSKKSKKNAKKKLRKLKKRLARLGGGESNPDEGFFEGAEKLFECWFDSSTDGYVSLRQLSRDDIDSLLELAKCTVVSHIRGAELDAYLLSESSLFVYDDMIILKTCGTTTLLHVVPAFLRLARVKCNATELRGLWYSRKNMARPDRQLKPHQNFEDEVRFLDKEMASLDQTGGAYLFGRWNGDHWYLYNMDSPAWDDDISPEMTFEILMSDLDQVRMTEHFHCKSTDPAEQRRLGKICTDASGIGAVLEGVTLDETMFYPYGYSMNGIKDRTYYTIHVTPQPECSYASFETNCRYENYEEIVSRIVSIFRPTRFIVNLTSEGVRPKIDTDLASFTRRDLVQYTFGRYLMQMGHWVSVKDYSRTESTTDLRLLEKQQSSEEADQ